MGSSHQDVYMPCIRPEKQVYTRRTVEDTERKHLSQAVSAAQTRFYKHHSLGIKLVRAKIEVEKPQHVNLLKTTTSPLQ